MRGGLARRLLLVASLGLLVVGNPLPEAMVPPGPMMLQGAPADDQSARSERSANLSHITGTARKIRMYIQNGYLQLMPDGKVMTNYDQLSDYTILQRSSVQEGQVKIQGVASCVHLCMDACGLLYGAREFSDECVFSERMEKDHYNIYSSTKYSNQSRTMYLALNNVGLPRKLMLRAKAPLSKFNVNTKVLTLPVDKVPNSLDPKTHSCPPPPKPRAGAEIESTKCRRRRKKKKRRRCPENRRPCRIDKDKLSNEGGVGSGEGGVKKPVIIRRKCEEENCRTKKLHMIGRKRKSRLGEGANSGLPPHPHDGIRHQQHAIKRTRHLHHLRHLHTPSPEEEDDLFEHDFDEHDLDNEDHNNNNNLATTIDPNNDDIIDDLTTDQQLVQLLDTNDK